MLTASVLTLQPAAATTLPTDQGRAIHAWFLDQVRRHDPALAHAIHDDQGPKPFTCSPLRGFRTGQPGAELHLSPDEAGWLRITTLSKPLSTLMVERILPELPETLSLGDAVSAHPGGHRSTTRSIAGQAKPPTPSCCSAIPCPPSGRTGASGCVSPRPPPSGERTITCRCRCLT